jgi:hypothetical protein
MLRASLRIFSRVDWEMPGAFLSALDTVIWEQLARSAIVRIDIRSFMVQKSSSKGRKSRLR